jgi:hypothetical protein
MTKLLVDKGVRKLLIVLTPGLCFVIAVREEFLKKHPNIHCSNSEIINMATQDFKEIPKY